MKEIILVKLGGSLITDKLKPYTVRQEVLDRLAKEIKESGCKNLIVGHGSGSFGHQSAHKYQTHMGIISEQSCYGIAVVQNDAAKLNRIVVKSFIDNGLNAISVQPSAGTKCTNGKIVDWDTDNIIKMIECGMLPVPYGDIGFDSAKGCCITSTEEVLSFLARRLGSKRMIVVGKVDGVLTSDPTKDKNAMLIKEITIENFNDIKNSLTGSDGIDVTGGMLGKVESLLELAAEGIEAHIINGDKPGLLKMALMGEPVPGTIIRK